MKHLLPLIAALLASAATFHAKDEGGDATPSAAEADALTQAETLLKQGFSKTSAPEFDLIFKVDEKARNSNACSVYQKELEEGETVRFGEWGVLVY